MGTVDLVTRPPAGAGLAESDLGSLYLATGLAGLMLLMLAMHDVALVQLLPAGFALFYLPYPLYALAGGPRRRAYLLIALWTLLALAALAQWPRPAVAGLCILPAILAQALIGRSLGLGVVSILSLASLWLARGSSALPEDWILSLGVVWLGWGFTWLATRPLRASLQWSWANYLVARQEREEARDAQADLKQAIHDLADASAQALRLNQLLGTARQAAEDAERARREFVTNVSHELRTPLNMIAGFSDIMMRAPEVYGESIPPALIADLRVIHRNAQHLGDLIDDVLDLSQIEAGRMALSRERVALHEIAAAAADAVQPLFGSKGLYLTLDVPADLPAAYCDRTRVREVLLNLLSNAGRFTEVGGVRVRAWREGDAVMVGVTDTGPGIDAAGQDRLFGPFQQADGSIRRRYGGTGLGLSISKGFIELHGGSMWLESELGIGTTFYFRLPIDPPFDGAPGPLRWINSEWEYRQRTRPTLAPAPVVRNRIVLSENGGALRRLLGRYLGDVDVVATPTVDEAFAELARSPASLLLLNAPSVADAMRDFDTARLPDSVPVLVCSVPGVDEAAAALGACDYLVKPVSAEALYRTLDGLGVKGGTVLVVDDEPDARRLLWRMLASSGHDYRVLTAGSGEEALALLATETPDAMLVDLTMEGMDGARLLQVCNQDPALQHIPAVVISARDPLGQPLVSSGVVMTRRGGLAMHELLACIESAGRIFSHIELAPQARRAPAPTRDA